MNGQEMKAYIELMKEFNKLPPEEKPADGMPELPIWRAKSFYYTVFGIAILVSAVFGFDLFGFLDSWGLGKSVSAVLSNLDVILLAASSMLAMRERLRPNYKLVWKTMRTIASTTDTAIKLAEPVARVADKNTPDT